MFRIGAQSRLTSRHPFVARAFARRAVRKAHPGKSLDWPTTPGRGIRTAAKAACRGRGVDPHSPPRCALPRRRVLGTIRADWPLPPLRQADRHRLASAAIALIASRLSRAPTRHRSARPCRLIPPFEPGPPLVCSARCRCRSNSNRALDWLGARQAASDPRSPAHSKTWLGG